MPDGVYPASNANSSSLMSTSVQTETRERLETQRVETQQEENSQTEEVFAEDTGQVNVSDAETVFRNEQVQARDESNRIQSREEANQRLDELRESLQQQPNEVLAAQSSPPANSVVALLNEP